jgi:PAS domain S-box-containing protein
METSLMAEKPTYEELVQRVKELESERLQARDEKILSKTFSEAPPLDIDLGSLINVAEIQAIMDDFCSLTGMVTAILDLNGKVIEATGWQDICTNFHRINPLTSYNCTESDLFLAQNLKAGEYIDYKCKNGLSDVVTPLYIGTTHLGNIFTGQFFYDDENINEEIFVKQADKYGFDKNAYIEAFRKIPRYSRKTVRHLMNFLVKFTSYISRISLSNLVLEREIQERQKAEVLKKETATMLQALIRAIPDLVWLKDKQGVYLFCNSRFESFFGAKETDIVGKTDYDFLKTDLADFFRKHDNSVIKNAKACKNEEEIVFATDGHREILETIKTPLYNSDGQIASILGIGRNITERKRIEKELTEYREHLEELVKVRTTALEMMNKEMETFTYSVSHDLKAPLRGIDGYSRLLEEEYADKLDEEGLLFLKNVRQSAAQMNQLIEDLLAYSRMERRDIQSVLIDLSSMIDILVSQRAQDLKARHIKMSVTLPFKTITSDIETLRQVLANYLDNAVKFSREDGSATIEMGGREDAASWTLWVKDNGIGFDPQYLDRIFEIFQRLHRTEDYPGTGIGLAIVRKAVERIGGQAWGESALGKGATFFVNIPKQSNIPTKEKDAYEPA